MTTEAAVAGPGVAPPEGAAAAASKPWPAAKMAYYTVFLLILSLTSLQVDTAIVPYLAGSIKKDLQLSDYDLSLLLGVAFALFYTVVGIPMAWLVDRYSRKWIIAIGIITWSLGTALCGLAQTYTQLFVARFIVGGGEAGNGPASYSVLADLFPREKLPRAVAFMQLGSVIGPALALLMSAWLLHIFLDMAPIQVPWGVLHGWQLILMMVGLPGLIVALLFIFTLPDTPRRIIPGQIGLDLAPAPKNLADAIVASVRDYVDAFKYMARHWPVFGPMFGGLFVSSLGLGAQQWMPIFYARTFNWHPAQLAGLSSLSQLVVMPLAMVLGVLLAEHYTRKGTSDSAIRVLVISRFVALPGMFAVMMPNPWLTYALSTLIFVGIGLGAPSQNAAMQTVCPAQMRGKITALYLFFFSVVGIGLSPIIVGAMNDFLFHDESMIRWSIFLPALILGPTSLFIIWLGQKPYGREVERLQALEAAGG